MIQRTQEQLIQSSYLVDIVTTNWITWVDQVLSPSQIVLSSLPLFGLLCYDSALDVTRPWNLFAIQVSVDFLYLKALFVSDCLTFNKIHLLLLYFGDIVFKCNTVHSVDIELQEHFVTNFKPYTLIIRIVVSRNMYLQIYTFDVFRFFFF